MALYKAGMPLLVMRSNDICFLGIMRSCRAAGVPAVAVTFTWPGAPEWMSDQSACVAEERTIANPYTDPEKAAAQFEAIACELAEQWQGRIMVVPSSDTNLMFLLDHWDQFSPYIRVMGHDAFDDSCHHVTHKADCAQLLMDSVPELVPTTIRCQNEGDISTAINNVQYPVVYKPAVKDYGQTFYRTHDGNKAIECDSPDKLATLLGEEIAAGFDLVVQEKIEFDSVYDEIPFYLYADEEHNIRMAANGIKELIEPFPFGTAIVLRFAWLPELLEHAQKVVKALRYRGILMIEFVRDAKDGRWKVVEVNPRPWLFNGFYQRLGVNYIEYLYKDLTGQLVEEPVLNVVSQEVLDADFAHIDVIEVVKKRFEDVAAPTLKDLKRTLENIKGSLTLAFLDPDDEGPGLRRIQLMAQLYGWDELATIELIKKQAQIL